MAFNVRGGGSWLSPSRAAHRPLAKDRFGRDGVDLGIPRDLPDWQRNDVSRRLQGNRLGDWGLDFSPSAVRAPRRSEATDRDVIAASPKYCSLVPNLNNDRTKRALSPDFARRDRTAEQTNQIMALKFPASWRRGSSGLKPEPRFIKPPSRTSGRYELDPYSKSSPDLYDLQSHHIHRMASVRTQPPAAPDTAPPSAHRFGLNTALLCSIVGRGIQICPSAAVQLDLYTARSAELPPSDMRRMHVCGMVWGSTPEWIDARGVWLQLAPVFRQFCCHIFVKKIKMVLSRD